jgi:hypothetical protein
MANIPLAQIPMGNSAGSSAVTMPVGVIRSPDIAQMPVIETDSYMAMGRAYEKLGAAGQRAAAVMGDFSIRMGEAADEANYAAADRMLTEASAEFEVESMTMPEEKHVETWETKYWPKVEKQITDMRMTGGGRARINAWMTKQAGITRSSVYVNANKKMVERGRLEVRNYIERAYNEGRDEDAMAAISRGISKGLYSKEEGDGMSVKLENDRKISTLRTDIMADPAKWKNTFSQWKKARTNPAKLRPEEVMSLEREATTEHGKLLQEFSNHLLDTLETDSPSWTNERIEAFFDDPRIDAPRELIENLKRHRGSKYAATPEGLANKAKLYGDLWQNIFNYNAASDVNPNEPEKHLAEYGKILNMITANAVEGERQQFLLKLNEQVGNARENKRMRSDEITRDLVSKVTTLADYGHFGDDGGWDKKEDGSKSPKDAKKYMSIQQKRLEAINAARQLMLENPELTEKQAYDRFKGVLDQYLDSGSSFRKQLAADSEGGFFNWIKSIVN